MTEFKEKPAKAQWLSVYLTVKDMAATLAFYQDCLGLVISEQIPGPDGGIMHAEISHKGQVVVMCAPEGAFHSTVKTPVTGGFEAPSTLYLYVDDVDAVHKQAQANGGKPLSEPEDMFWGDRIFRVTDPSGHSLMVASHIGEENAPPAPF